MSMSNLGASTHPAVGECGDRGAAGERTHGTLLRPVGPVPARPPCVDRAGRPQAGPAARGAVPGSRPGTRSGRQREPWPPAGPGSQIEFESASP